MSALLVFDFETTGPNPHDALPVQVSLLSQNEESGAQQVYINARCNPGVPIPEGAANVHGIRDMDVAYMPFYTLQLWQLEQMVMNLWQQDHHSFLAGHNISQYDVPLWKRRSATCGDLPMSIDSLDLLNRLYPDMGSKKLGDAYETLLGTRPGGLHDAMVDCMVAGQLIAFIAKDKNMTFLEMAQWLDDPMPYEIMPFGKHQGMPVEDVPKQYLEWCAANFDRIRPDLQATIDEVL